jgi:hypothetical protein
MVMLAVAIGVASTATLLGTHIRTGAAAEDGERLYYALESSVEAVMADLVRGADALDPSYVPATTTLNDITPSVTTTAPGAVATPTAIQQYFDPGVRNPELLHIPEGDGYLLHILNVYPTSTIDANWSFTLAGETPSATVRIRLFDNKSADTPGRTTGCPAGSLAGENAGFIGPGPHSLRLGSFNITQSGIYSIAFCVPVLVGTLTTETAKLNGALEDTWVYAIAFKDYVITAEAEGASVTAYVRQTPGPTQPPTGDWADDNISWTTNLVTPYQWDR